MAYCRQNSLGFLGLLARRFRRDEQGVTAIEFAVLGPIFFALIGASMETALVFFASQALDSAVHDSSRLIRTGQVQQQAMTAAQYRARICDQLYGMFDCEQVQVSVREIPSFSNFQTSDPIDPDSGEWTIETRFQPGTGASVVLVEAYYKWPTVLNIPGLMQGVTADGKRLLGAARVFRNEPFGA